jgi:hypothetical protein
VVFFKKKIIQCPEKKQKARAKLIKVVFFKKKKQGSEEKRQEQNKTNIFYTKCLKYP